jgi:sodium/hydrogen exchanger-like protein 6/7
MAQLTENFIFIYLGLSLFTERVLEYKPLFILITLIGICIARWAAVFPLSALINWVIRYKAKRRGQEVAEEIPQNWKIMLFWAGLRGAVGVALAAGLTGTNGYALRATVLVTVVLTVIIFGGTTARMLEILNIRTGVVDEIDSDDEFDIEPVPQGAYARRNGAGIGHSPKHSKPGNGAIGLGRVNHRSRGDTSSYNAGAGNPTMTPDLERRNSSRVRRGDVQYQAEEGLLYHEDESNISDDDLGLPPEAKKAGIHEPYPQSGTRQSQEASSSHLTARGAISQILDLRSEDAGTLFNRLDENFLKPHLLLDPGGANKHGGGDGGNGGGGA